MLFASWLDSTLGWCCLAPVVLLVLFLWSLSSAAQSVAGWFTSESSGVVEEAAKEVAKEVAQEIAQSWLEEWLRGWFK